MWLFLPDAFYSIRSYRPEKGGVAVEEPHVVIRARVQADVDKVRNGTDAAFDLAPGSDYRYHLALPVSQWVHFLERQTEELEHQVTMKHSDNPRIDVHAQVWNATWGLGGLDRPTSPKRGGLRWGG